MEDRARVLQEAIELTTNDRNKTYGPPGPNMALASALKRAFWDNTIRPIGPAEREAVDMILTKLSRIGAGAVHRDNYIDAAAYCAIAYENALFDGSNQPVALSSAQLRQIEEEIGVIQPRRPTATEERMKGPGWKE